MPSYDPALFNVNPYYDDFNEEKKFLRMLFRPGFAVQSRELTQLQTILQNQIERFGNHIFKDGTAIIGGEISTQTLSYVRLFPTSVSVPNIAVTKDDLVGNKLIQRDGSGNVVAQATVVDLLDRYSAADDFPVAIISYISGNTFGAGITLESSNPDKNINVFTCNDERVVSGGRARVTAVSDGIYYVNGHFVRTGEQIEPAYTVVDEKRNFESPTGMMGFEVNREIVTEREDFTLKDPANGSYNYNAPGSHRFKLDLVLKFVESTDNLNFIELVKYENGTITKKNESVRYADLINLFAQRTYDESGNYTVKPFEISMREGGETAVFADISSGKAYVFGHEFETQFRDSIEIPKARTLATYADYAVDNYYGNYVLGKYNPSAGDRINILFSSLSRGSGNRSVALPVYGATGPLTLAEFPNKAVFQSLLVGVEPVDEDIFSTQGATLQFKAHLSNFQSINPTGTFSDDIDLFVIDNTTGTSTKIFSDLKYWHIEMGLTTSNARIPKIYDQSDMSLLFAVNGNTPTTMVSGVNQLSHIEFVSQSFVVDAANPLPRVQLGRGGNYNWCFANGFVPSGKDINLDEEDGYYVVYESGTLLPIGTVIKIVSNNVNAGANKATARITSDGDYVEFTSQLPVGSYYLVGKAKNEVSSINTQTSTKVRTKTLTTASEVINSQTFTLNTFKRNITRNTSQAISEMYFLFDQSDVVSIDTITDAAGNDIRGEFLFDTGQRDSAYLFGRIYVKPEYFSKYDVGQSFEIQVTYKYYTHAGFGPFVKNSYIGVSYENIQVYVSPRTGESIHLANALDYRYRASIIGFFPSGATSGSTGATAASSIFNVPAIRYSNGFAPIDFTVQTTHTAYLPRIDKIVVSKNIAGDDDISDTSLRRIAGIPGDTPLVPEDSADSMTLFVLSVPAYTFNASDVKTESIENNRYTMKDIGDISDKINALEQTAVLTDLELSVVSKDINNASGADAIKRAILVDTFNGHSVGDVSDEDYRCSIDVETGELRPSFESTAFSFQYDGSDPGITITPDNILCADYVGITFISQPKASDTIAVNTFALPNWVGNIKVTPTADYWYDTSARPFVKNNDNGFNDAWLISNMNSKNGHGSQWNDWESIWTGIPTEMSEAETQKNAEFFANPREKEKTDSVEKRWYNRGKISRFTDPLNKVKAKYRPSIRKNKNYVQIDSGTLLNKSVCPYMRTKTISFNAYNLKPKTEMHVFLDNTNVDSYCTIGGVSGPFVTSTADGSLLNMQLVVPASMFESGNKILRVVDDANNNIDNATTIAEKIFYSRGSNIEKTYDISAVRPVEIRKQTPNSNNVITNPLYRNKTLNTTKYNQWIDPVAQTFTVSENDNPAGVFLESVDLFFATKDNQLPVSVEICAVVSGIPHPCVILPFSTVVKNPSSVNANSATPTATNFKFSTPVYLAPGEYALLVRTNSSAYTVFVANIGGVDLVTEKRISSTFTGGVLYRSQNSTEPVGDSNTDLMFTMKTCFFEQFGSVILEHVAAAQPFEAHVVQPNLFVFTPIGTAIGTKLVVGGSEYDANISRNFPLKQPFSINGINEFNIVVDRISRVNRKTTPMIDMDRTNAVAIKNLINNSSDSVTIEEAIRSGITDDTARYITKKVLIPADKTAKELKVLFDANIPQNSTVEVYAKLFNNEIVTSEFSGYKKMTIDNTSQFFSGGEPIYSLNESDYRETSYSYVMPTTGGQFGVFNVFAVKICMYSSNKAVVPKIKNLRVVAIE